jgi:WhiB family redox-sensing transcriptional regulator
MLVMNSDGMNMDLAILHYEILDERPDPPTNGRTIGPSDEVPLPPDLEDWKSFGACVGVDPNIFYPTEERNQEQVERALSYCGACAVREICLDYALTNKEYGIWGGTIEKERRRILRLRRNSS